MLLMVMDAVPGLDAITDIVLLLLLGTLPKSKVVAAKESVFVCNCLESPPTLTPWHPTSRLRPANRRETSKTAVNLFRQMLAAVVLAIMATNHASGRKFKDPPQNQSAFGGPFEVDNGGTCYPNVQGTRPV